MRFRTLRIFLDQKLNLATFEGRGGISMSLTETGPMNHLKSYQEKQISLIPEFSFFLETSKMYVKIPAYVTDGTMRVVSYSD